MATLNGRGFRSITATFTRPADTTAYADGDLVANSTTAASVVPMEWTTPRAPFQIPAIKLEKSTASVTGATFRLHVFVGTIPTIATTGDNGVFASVVSGKAVWFGAFEGTLLAFADGAVGMLTPVSGVIRPDMITTTDTKLYALLEAKGAYTPGSAEVFVATLIQEFAGWGG